MILIKPDFERRIEIPGVREPVRRPVDIDRSMTGFTSLRTLRIYRFDEGSLIEGHAEEDEVFLVVLSGSVDLTMTADHAEDSSPVTLSAPGDSVGIGCAAYLPPYAAYNLVPRGGADVAYARATPTSARSPKVFSSLGRADAYGVHVLLEETSYAERLRIRLLSFDKCENELALAPINEGEAMCEGLIHVRMAASAKAIASVTGSKLEPIYLNSWDTVAAVPGESLILNIAQGSSGLVLTVMAR